MTQRLQELVVGLLIAGSPIFSGVLHAQSQSQPRDLTQRSLEDLLGVEVVSSASRSNQRVAEAPANVTIVTAEEIMRHGYRTLGELLQNVRGLYLSDDRNHLYLGIRGFDRPGDFNNRVLLMVDGHRINDNIYGMAALDTSFGVDLAIVDRVEIVRGPGSSLYGTNAMFGVINVVTRRPSSSSGLQVGADVSDRATGRADVSYGKSFGRSRGLLVAFNTGQDARGLEDDSFSRFFAKASYRDFSVHASFVSHERILLLPVLGPFAEPRSRALDSGGYVELEYDRRYGPGSDLTMKISFDESRYRGQYDYVRRDGSQAPWTTFDGGQGRWLNAEAQGTRTFSRRHRVTIGSELRWDAAQDVGPSEGVGGVDGRSSAFFAVFAHDRFRLTRAATVNAGVRYDRYGTFGGTVNPRFALLLQPTEATAVKLIYGRAFRAPTAFELYRDRDRRGIPKLDLRPERIHTYEASVDRGLGPWVHMMVSTYDYRMRDVISLGMVRVPFPMLIYRNRDEAGGRGVETELRARSPLGVDGSVSYGYQRTRNERGEELTNSPRHVGTARITVPLAEHRVFVAANTRYVSSRLSLNGNRSRSTFLTDATITGLVKPRGLDLVLSVYNIFDERTIGPSWFATGAPHVGRTWRAGVRTSF